MKMKSVICTIALCFLAGLSWGMPLPFTRILKLANPAMSGSDVRILQGLLQRAVPETPQDSVYNAATAAAVSEFQGKYYLAQTGVFADTEAAALLDCCSDDGYREDGEIPSWAKYKIVIPVYRDRTKESAGALYAANGTLMLTFPARTHGVNEDGTDVAENMFSPNGVTPTGLMSCDLNSPEPDPLSYGPYPINRMVQGLAGNAGFLISDIRDGILLHTGEWAGWHPPMPMPNSHGCIHSYPDSIRQIWQTLVSLGVEVRNNTFGKLPYPYDPQGVMSIFLME